MQVMSKKALWISSLAIAFAIIATVAYLRLSFLEQGPLGASYQKWLVSRSKPEHSETYSWTEYTYRIDRPPAEAVAALKRDFGASAGYGWLLDYHAVRRGGHVFINVVEQTLLSIEVMGSLK